VEVAEVVGEVEAEGVDDLSIRMIAELRLQGR